MTSGLLSSPSSLSSLLWLRGPGFPGQARLEEEVSPQQTCASPTIAARCNQRFN